MAYFRYVLNLKRPPGVFLVVGSATHKIDEVDLRSKLTTGALLPDEVLADLASTTFDATWEGEAPELDEEEKSAGREKVKGQAKDLVIRLSKTYHAQVAPGIDPTHVEQALRLECPGFPFDLQGTVDVYEGGIRKLRDTKTSARKLAADSAIGNIQLDFYSMMLGRILGEPVREVQLDVILKSKKGETQALLAPATTNFAPLVDRIERTSKVFETGAFVPVDRHGPSGWICQSRFCGFWDDICPHGKRALVQVAMPGIRDEADSSDEGR